jgi:hypothetical protein
MTNEESFSRLLKRTNSRSLEAHSIAITRFSPGVLSDLTDNALEGQLSNEELATLLIALDLSEGHGYA